MKNIEWFILLLAGISEVTWAVAMKMSDGFSKLLPTIVMIVFYVFSGVTLSLALKKLPLGIAYTMWTSFGIVGTTCLSAFLFQEHFTPIQMVCVGFIVLGIAGLKCF
jgi:quaternary ammonium compound-resistance protein SugE